jgi:hypothetical protein
MSENFKDNPSSEETLTAQNDSAEAATPSEVTEILPEQHIADDQEGTVSPEEGQQVLEQGQAYQTAETLALHINKTDGTTYTAEDLMNSPDSATWVSQFIEKHPAARKALNIFMLSTALAGAAAPQEAKADTMGNIITTVVQGTLQQRNAASQQQIYQEQMKSNQAIQKQQSERYARQAQQDMLNRQQTEREDLAHRRRMEGITDRYAREDAELSYRQEKERKIAALNTERQQAAQNTQAQIQEERIKQQQGYQQRQIGVNIQNQVIQQGAHNFLQNILMKR